MRRAWEQGVVLAGVSAGMNCWFAGSVTDSFGSELAPLHDGLALIAASSCPHYDGEPQRRPAYRVERRDREAHEERLEARYLGG